MKLRWLVIVALFFFVATSSLFGVERLTWEQCVKETKVAHPDLSSALALLQQAEADKLIAVGAGRPQLSFAANVQERGISGSASSSLFSTALSAQQLLYDGRKTMRQIDSNKEMIKAAQYNYQYVSANLRFALRSAFTDLLKAQHLVGLTAEIAERRQKNARLINLRYQGGRENIGSLRQAEADVAQAQFEVAQAERALQFAQTALALVLGRDSRQPLNVQGKFTLSNLLSRKPDMTLLTKQHPLVQQLSAQTKAAQYNVDVAQSAFSPQLSLSSSVGGNSPDRFTVDPLNWSAGVTLTMPIYEGGSGNAKVAKAKAALNEQKAQEKSSYLQLVRELEERWKNLQDTRQQIVVREKFLAAAVERATIATAQYSNGLISFNDWVMIEDNLVSAKKEFLNAGAAMLIAEAQWIQSKGGGLDAQEK